MTDGSHAQQQFSRRGLREATLDGVRWVTLARVTAEALAFVSGVVLAHLVPPAEFGRLAVAVIVSELAQALAAEGIGSPLVQRKTVERAHLECGVLLSLVLGLFLMGAVLLFAPLAVTPLFGAETADLFQLFSPAFLIAGLRVVPQAMLQRALDFRRLSLIEIASTLSGACVSVLLASAADLDAEAYVVGTLASGAIALVLLAATARPPLPRWHRRQLRELLGFGLPAGAAGVVWVGNRNADYAILGATMGPAQVGYYYRAYTLGVESEQRVSGIVSRLILPVYSRTRDLSHMRDVRARVIRANAMIVFPVLALFISVAPTLVPWMFGARWEPAVLPAQILALGGMASIINGNMAPMVVAAGKPRVLALFNICQLCAFILTVLASASFGIVAVASAVAAFQVCALVIAYVVVMGRVAGLRLEDLLHDVGPAVLTSALLVVVALPTDAVLASTGAGALPAVLAAAAAGGFVYLLAARSLFPSAFADVVLVTRRIVGFRARREASAMPLAEGGAGAA